ncbi:hypothetical protein GUJ93_ZPchr0011g28069 [Zizania palustris]|uniref:C2H2-type domain-containing protein n=1 Tax=Zizania palustris TaxID=103762 RepID=A0A8J5WHI3_ZIZPA|nr:hypothetical protein GUJ93_ZPchr0011g28069 [Zizania palustris]
MPSSTMEATADKNQYKSGKKLSTGGSGGTMGFYSSSSSYKNRSQSAAGKNSSSKDKKKRSSISISRSMTCAGSICSTKESSVSSRGSRRRSSGRDGAGSTSSRSLMAPDYCESAVSSAAVSASSSFNSEMTTVATSTTTASSSTSPKSALSSPLFSIGGSFRAMQIRKLSGCYQSQSVLDPRSLGAVFSCADCNEVFIKADSLELHRATRHAVSELGPEDTSRNIVEIIFQSSWLKKHGPICKIDRILKVHTTDKAIKRFEQYKEFVKEKAASSEAKKNPRCVADGNELLRFHCTTFSCPLGLAGGTAPCCSTSPQCKLCSIIKDGFRVSGNGKIATMATSGRAHDMAEVSSDGEERAMLVCRVVAGRVKKISGNSSSEELDCDSISSCSEGVYSDLDELFVFSPRAILPCFVVIYSGY